MSFFRDLNAEMVDGQVVRLAISKINDKLTVVMTFDSNAVEDKKLKEIPPLIATGTPEELDADYLKELKEPLEVAQGIITDLVAWKKEAEKKAEQTEAKKAEKDEAKKAKEKVKTHVNNLQEFLKEKNWSQCVKTLNQIKEIDKDEHEKRMQIYKDARAEDNQVDIFQAGAGTDPLDEE